MAKYYNETLLLGCPPPLYNARSFSADGGFLDGRVCLPPTGGENNITCCLPCPITQWVYEESYHDMVIGTGWVSVVSMILLLSLLISYAVLPVKYTRSHYLNVCLIVTVMAENLGFVIPLGAGKKECTNAITPADMYTSTSCAFSGTFILLGGLTSCTWVFLRALSMHLQICWDITPGRKFFYLTMFVGWAAPTALFAAAMIASGVSARFGPGACHINHHNSVLDFWGWLLALAGISISCQLGTMFYCFHVYLRNLFSDEPEETQATGATRAPTYTSSQRAATARAIYNRLKRVLWLQWRGLALVTLMLADVTFFAVVFVYLDKATAINDDTRKRVAPLIICLLQNPNDREKCYVYGQRWLLNENTINAVFVVLSFVGIILFLLLFRFSFITGWIEWARLKMGKAPREEFVSVDAAQHARRRQYAHAAGTEDEEEWQRQDAKGAMFEMQRPARDGGRDMEHSAGSPSMSTIGTGSPIEKSVSPTQFVRSGADGLPGSYGHLYQPQHHMAQHGVPQRPPREEGRYGSAAPAPEVPSYAGSQVDSQLGSQIGSYDGAAHSRYQATSTTGFSDSPAASAYSARPHSPYGGQYPAVSPYGEQVGRYGGGAGYDWGQREEEEGGGHVVYR